MKHWCGGYRVLDYNFFVILCSTVLVACSGPQREVRVSPHKSSVAFSTPADLRLAFLRDESDTKMKLVYCAEPMPDVSLGSEQTASGSLSAAAALAQTASTETNAALSAENKALRKDLSEAIAAYEAVKEKGYTRSLSSSTAYSSSSSTSLNLEAAYKLAITVAELGGRSQQVLLAREFLYRLCEARANQFFSDDQAYIQLQNNALKMIQSISAPLRPTARAEQAELAKRLAEYVTKQSELCEAKHKACIGGAADDAAKRVCAQAHQKCLNAIEPPSTSSIAVEDKATPDFELTIPVINKK
jgi:hypothetical protein